MFLLAEFRFIEAPHTIHITPGPDTSLNLTCYINCTGNEAWANSGCGVEPNVVVIVPFDHYAAHEVCYHNQTFRRKNYNVSVSCHLGHIDKATFCANMEEVMYNVTLQNFSATSPRELVVVCGMTPTSGSQALPALAINGLLHRKFIIKVQGIHHCKKQIVTSTLSQFHASSNIIF